MPDLANNFVVVIPARFSSTRLPGKPLLKIVDKTLIRHVCDKAQMSLASQVVVATDDQRIADHLKGSNITVVMTSVDCQSGTDRIAQAVTLLNLAADTVIVNLQGDEPFMPAMVINQMAQTLIDNPDVSMSTGCEPIRDKNDWANPNVVKVTRDKNNRALYFSRSQIPYTHDSHNRQIFKHLGIYAYRVKYIKEFASLPPCELERTEKLEQLRALYNGDRIIATEVNEPTGVGVDTAEDLETARNIYQQSLSP